MDRFDEYKEGFGDEIYHTERKRELLEELFARYDEHQVASAKQIAEWVDSDTNKLNANNVWTIFLKYGLLAKTQKIYSQHENRLFITPILTWLDQWNGKPGAVPTTDDSIQQYTPVRETLKDQQVAEASQILEYILARLNDTDSVPDPKEAILYAKLTAQESVTITNPDVSVDIHRLDESEFDEQQPDSYEALRITGEITGDSIDVPDWETAKKHLRPALQFLALAGCYHYKAAKLPSDTAGETEAIPAHVDEAIQEEDDEEDGSEATFAPYVINKTEFIRDSQPPKITREADNEISFTYQLGPTWVRWEVVE